MSKGSNRELTPHERLHWLHTVQSNQKHRVVFVKFLNRQEISPRRFVKFTKYKEINGLEVENRLFFVKNGVLQFCYLNKKGCKVLHFYEGIPRWAEEELRALYAKKKEEFNLTGESVETP